MKGSSTTLPSLDWDGQSNFLLNSIFRYQFGYLYSYNLDTKQTASLIAPMGANCCYTDARWSPDGSYILFAFQDINQGNQAKTQLFYVSYGSIGTGAQYTPLPLPAAVLSNPLDQPDTALRPAR
jgi:Tol biopolymer transport system component